MATETVINRPAPFVEDIGKSLAEQTLAQQQVPVVTTGTFCNAKACSDNFLPISSTNGAGRFITVSVAII